MHVQHVDLLPTLSLLQSDKSILTNDQWMLLTNLFNYFKECPVFSIAQQLIRMSDGFQSSYRMYTSCVEQFLVCIYNTAGTYLHSNDELRNLSFDNRAIMLRSAADNVCCLGSVFIMQHCSLYSQDVFLNAVHRKYEKNSIDIHVWAADFVDSDIVLAKLLISLFDFSENNSLYYSNMSKDLTNLIHILEIQNKYAEVAWKYLLYRYDYCESVKRFLNLFIWLTSINILVAHARTRTLHVNDIDSVIEQTELTFIFDDVDEIVERNE
ncbi:unnamed protein product [Rotaria magnacalcarata]|uniref:Uncharacterized protein n=1 Tax=Rotaria magnacalcarata TaxID=392030 RepID=A0A816R9R4_9BILA|nr:unnamed protein product [Rotaria magnacalcarata]